MFMSLGNIGKVLPGIRDLRVGPKPLPDKMHFLRLDNILNFGRDHWIEAISLVPGEEPTFSEGDDNSTNVRSRNISSLNFNDAISKFSNLVRLEVNVIPFNGDYPGIYQLANLQFLSIHRPSENFTMDLLSLSPLKHLKVLKLSEAGRITGSLKSLEFFSSQLNELDLVCCSGIRGNLLDLSRFASLKKLQILCPLDGKIDGDIRKIGPTDFPAMEVLALYSDRIHGSWFTSIPEAEAVVQGLCHLFKQKRPLRAFGSSQSVITDLLSGPEVHECEGYQELAVLSGRADYPEFGHYDLPYDLKLVKFDSTFGWRWGSARLNYNGKLKDCDIVWLDAEPALVERGDRLLHDPHSLYFDFTRPPDRDEYIELLLEHEIIEDATEYFDYVWDHFDYGYDDF